MRRHGRRGERNRHLFGGADHHLAGRLRGGTIVGAWAGSSAMSVITISGSTGSAGSSGTTGVGGAGSARLAAARRDDRRALVAAGRVVGLACGHGGEQAGGDQRDRLGPRQRLGGLDQAASELGGRRTVFTVRTAGSFEHGGERTEVGRDRHQLADAAGERRHGRVAGERHRPGDRFDQRQRQRVHVGLGIDLHAERLLGRGISRHVGRHVRRVLPRIGTEQFGEAEVDDPQPAIVAEHELGRGDLGVHDAALMGEVERPARLEADHERLRRLERASTVEQVAQAAAGEVFAGPEPGRLRIFGRPAPRSTGPQSSTLAMFGWVRAAPASQWRTKSSANPGRSTSSGRTILSVTGWCVGLVERDGDDRVRTCRDHRLDAVAIGERAPDEPVGRLGRLRVVECLGLLMCRLPRLRNAIWWARAVVGSSHSGIMEA